MLYSSFYRDKNEGKHREEDGGVKKEREKKLKKDLAFAPSCCDPGLF